MAVSVYLTKPRWRFLFHIGFLCCKKKVMLPLFYGLAKSETILHLEQKKIAWIVLHNYCVFKAIPKEQNKKDKNDVLLTPMGIFDGNSRSSLNDNVVHVKLTHS